jgi:FkbM family methyltransferase
VFDPPDLLSRHAESQDASVISRLLSRLGLHRTRTTLDVPGAGRVRLRLHRHPDQAICGPLRQGQLFEPHVLAVLSDLLTPGAVCLDVGANLGWFTVIASRLVGSRGRVLALEPDPANLRLLRRNVALNGCTNVTVVAAAAGAGKGRAQLYRSNENLGDHRLATRSDRPDRVEVAVESIDDIVAGSNRDHHAIETAAIDTAAIDTAAIDTVKIDTDRIDVVKIDTQGSESAILRGMEATFAASPRLRMILEYWPHGLHQCGSSVEELVRLLAWRPCLLWLLHPQGHAQPVTTGDLLELARTTYTIDNQAHSDIVCLAADDREAIECLRRREQEPVPRARPDTGPLPS